MIFDKFENADKYAASHPYLSRAIAFAQQFDPNSPDGRYEIDGKKFFANVNTYKTEPIEDLPFESHEKHIDVQILLKGTELIGITHETLTVNEPYCQEDDYSLFDAPAEYSTVLMKPGYFLLLLPHDIHQPGITHNQVEDVQKVVAKILI